MSDLDMSKDLQHLQDEIESGLTVWPDGTCAICIFNREPYQEFRIGYIVGLGSDAAVCEAMRLHLREIKNTRTAKYISWRKRLAWTERPLRMGDITVPKDSGEPVTLLTPIRILRCRVLITANTNDPGWVCDPITGNYKPPPGPRDDLLDALGYSINNWVLGDGVPLQNIDHPAKP